MVKCILTEQIPPGLAIGDTFEVTLSPDNWTEKQQTVSNAKIFKADSYNYIVGPDTNSYEEYTGKSVRANDITEDGKMTFSCKDTPSSELHVEVLRLEVRNNG